MTFPTIKPSLNGKVEAPSANHGASLIPPKRTAFPAVSLRPTWRTWIYGLSQRHFAGAPLLRWLLIGLAGAMVLWWGANLPGGWWVATLLGAGWLSLLVLINYWRRSDFVYFVPSAQPTTRPALLSTQEKIPVHVTGLFSVENKYHRFTWLPGFYRTFATREHALLCQRQQLSLPLLGQLPSDELGLWYIFFIPAVIKQIAYGRLWFGREANIALAITYRITIPQRNRFQPEQNYDEIIYLAVESESDATAILADLLYDLPSTVVTTVAKQS